MTQPVMLIHGYNDTAAIWQPLISVLNAACQNGAPTAAHLCVHSVQLAKTPSRASADSATLLEQFCEQVEQAIRGVQTPGSYPWILVGHSMGGAIAELITERAKVNIGELILLTPAPLAGVPLDEATMSRFQSGFLEPNLQRARAVRAAMSVNLSEADIDLLVNASAQLEPELLYQQLTAWTGGHPAGRSPSTIACDVTVVTTEDRFFTQEMLKHMAKRFVNGRTVHIPQAGHWVHREQPEAVAQLIQDARRH
ncbi:alpha/beta fold hydrolase [Ottowia thiooxydans]